MLLGPIRLIDPNGVSNFHPVITSNNSASQLFQIIPDVEHSISGPYSTYNILAQYQFDYEQIQMFNFEMVVLDSEDNMLSSTATVQINITPVNEYSPVFLNDRYCNRWRQMRTYVPSMAIELITMDVHSYIARCRN